MKSRITFLLGLSLSRLIRSTIIVGVLVAITVFLLSLRHSQAAPRPFTVNSLSDTDDDHCDSADCTLREAMKAANSIFGADTINFSITGIINLTRPLPDITDDVTIDGPGVNLLTVGRDTGGDYRIFTVMASGMVNFSDLTIANGRLSAENGGAGIINASSGTVNVTNCELTNNSTAFSLQPPLVGSGGAIFNSSVGTLNVTNSKLSDNSNTGFTGNGGDGGAIANSGTATITNTTLSNNSSRGRGGAIYNDGSMTVDSSTISDNLSRAAGGIYNAGTLDITQSTLSNNTSGGGGGIHNAAGTVTVTNSTLSGNSGNNGGGIFNVGTANVTSSTLSNNSASTDGGGVANTGSLTIDSSIVALNTAPIGPDFSGSITSLGHNTVGYSELTFTPAPGDQVGVTPEQLKLGPLANNGGLTQTMELCRGSVAIDAGHNTVLAAPLRLTTDQRGRGFARRIGPQVDVGAYEVRGLARLCP